MDAARGLVWLCVLVCLCSTPQAFAKEAAPRKFILNEEMISEVSGPRSADDCNPKEVLHDLLLQLGPVAHVYPSENYYYFRFYRSGKSYSASLRLSVDKRDLGLLPFTCGETPSSWLKDGSQDPLFVELGKSDGVILRKIDDFTYSIQIEDLKTIFTLNKIDQTPDPDELFDGEVFSGRTVDDSGVMFDLIYNANIKVFYFILSSRAEIAETFVVVKPNVFIGVRTGFVFFQDVVTGRFMLIAVHAEDIRDNTEYDGPFDHLPENYYSELKFWNSVYDAYPDLAGKLTAGGTYIGLPLVFGIAPYREYSTKEDLAFTDECIAMSDRGRMLECFAGGVKQE